MPPIQATLSKFYGNPKKNPIPAKQTKLSFASKASKKENENFDLPRTKLKYEPVGENNELETNKRVRSPISEQLISQETSDESNEDINEEPVSKRRRTLKAKHDHEKAGRTQQKHKTKTFYKIEEFSEELLSTSKKSRKIMEQEKFDSDNEENSLENTPRRQRSSSPKLSEQRIQDDYDKNTDVMILSDIPVESQEKIHVKLNEITKDPYPDWEPGEPAPYAALCTTFSLIEMTTKRLTIASHCALFLRQVLRLTPDDLLPTVLLMINKLAADYAGIELGIGESLIMKAIGESTGRSLSVIKEDHKETGDLGLVAVKSRARQPTMFAPKPLTIRGVHKALIEIATVTGQGAQTRKIDLIKKILSAADVKNSGVKVDITEDKGGASEAKFIVRFLEGKLRLGLAEKTVLVSLAHAIIYHETEAKQARNVIPSPEKLAKGELILKAVYSELPSYEVIVPAMLKYGIFPLHENCKLQPGIPLKPMLAKPTKAITEVLDRFENQAFTCEFKYDGERAQIHYVAKDSVVSYAGPSSIASETASGGLAAIFSRNSEDLSKKYPDILAKLHTWVRPETKSFVLDCESVAWDVVEQKVLPFQQLMTRKKKDVKIEDVKVKVCVFAFDLLFFNGEAIVQKSLRERRELLFSAFISIPGEFGFAAGMDGQELEDIQNHLDESVKASCEGLMVKMLDGPESSYEPSKRSQNWLKIKKDYLSGIGDSLDLVVIGAYYGKGKRTSVYGAFLLACYNPGSEGYETICNIGTGFTEVVLEELHQQLSCTVIDRPKPYYYHASSGSHQPDVWFAPKYVWEIKTADLTLSPRYKAGLREGIDRDKGISLRFPRFIKVRDDKKPEMATHSRQVVEMYRKQESVTKSLGPAVDDDFEY